MLLVPKACPPWWVALGNALVPAVALPWYDYHLLSRAKLSFENKFRSQVQLGNEEQTPNAASPGRGDAIAARDFRRPGWGSDSIFTKNPPRRANFQCPSGQLAVFPALEWVLSNAGRLHLCHPLTILHP